jgi:uncharacterized protein YbgA (DUF1722 family)
VWRSGDRAPLVLNLSTIRKWVVKVPGALLAEKVTTVPFEQIVGWAPVQKKKKKKTIKLPENEKILRM